MQRRLTDDEFKDASEAEAAIRRLTVGGLIPSVDLLQTLIAMRINGTTDGRPYVEPPLTDEDARQRPWIMVRDADTNPWNGPFVFICKTKERWGFAVTQPDFCELQSFRYARRATPDEIAAAGLEVTK
jgi:hypothetical protein